MMGKHLTGVRFPWQLLLGNLPPPDKGASLLRFGTQRQLFPLFQQIPLPQAPFVRLDSDNLVAQDFPLPANQMLISTSQENYL